MINAFAFVLIGFGCGFFLRLPAFMLATCLLLLAYGVALMMMHTAGSTLAIDLVLALIAIQIGYCTAIALRLGVARARRAAPRSTNPSLSDPSRKK